MARYLDNCRVLFAGAISGCGAAIWWRRRGPAALLDHRLDDVGRRLRASQSHEGVCAGIDSCMAKWRA